MNKVIVCSFLCSGITLSFSTNVYFTSVRKKFGFELEGNINHDQIDRDQCSHLRIAQIATPFIAVPPINYGGTESVIYNLIESLIYNGHDVTLFATGDSHTSGKLKFMYPQSFINANMSWTEIGKARKHLIWAFNESWKGNKRKIEKYKYNYDIIHVHLSSASDIIFFELASMSPIPVIATLHSNFPYDRRPNHVGEEDSYYLQWSQKLPLVYISETAKQEAIKQAPVPLHFLDLIYHGLAEEEFHDRKEVVRDSLVWLGRISHDKGTHIVLKAAIQLNMTLIFAGVMDQEPEFKYFNDKIKPLMDAYPNLISYIGKVNRHQRSMLLKRGLVFLNPILWEEPFGLVMIEAMAQGCPVIAFKTGAARKLIRSGINGELADDLNDMVRQVPEVIKNINRTKMIKWTREHHSAKSMALEYIIAYYKVIELYRTNKFNNTTTVHMDSNCV